MKIPKKIKDAIYKCAEYYTKANFQEKEIREWLEKNKLTEDTAEDINENMDDTFIDCCILSNNPQRFIERLEEL